LGAAFLVSNQLNVDWNRYGWPVFVIAPGVFLLLVGLAMRDEAGLGMAIPGGMITSVGLLLALQNASGAWASWAYAWALVAPGVCGRDALRVRAAPPAAGSAGRRSSDGGDRL